MTEASGGPGAADAATRIDGLFELAFRRHQAGALREAEELYRAILEADPRQLDCFQYLGMIALQDGQPGAAVNLIGQAIAANDRIAPYHASIAEAYRALGQPEAAIEHYRKATAIDPGHWAAHDRLADLLRERGEIAAAAEHYAKAVAIKPDLASAQHNLAVSLLDQGHVNDALAAVSRALSTKDTENSRTLFVLCVRNATSLPGDPGFRALLTRALSEAWGRPVDLAIAAIALIKADPAIAAGIKAAETSWPRRLSPREIGHLFGRLAGDPLLHNLLVSTPVCDSGLERLLASVRTILLDSAISATTDVAPELIAFSCALARQCFINEYVYDVSDAEQQGLGWLRNTVSSALSSRTPVFAVHLIALSAYLPLQWLDRGPSILSRKWPAAMDGLLTEQLREPDEEARIRKILPILSAIADDVSVRVREQYEVNPYPRWTKSGPVSPATGIASYLQAELLFAPVQTAAEPASLDILIAGCGTGLQPIDAAQRFPHARVLAIDLSLTSLAYARRKAEALGITNIEFAQADIVQLSLPGRTFDVIEASGVLHHLADPMQGWAQLLQLLKPGGFMRLGFYSALARTDVVEARKFIAERGHEPTPEGIRRCRQDLISAQDPRFGKILGSPDFYSTSACRDLLFHVQEHRLTLPQIGAFVLQHDLLFLGFELSDPVLAAFRSRYPEDTGTTDLERWHLFETEYPETFAGMYQFWVQKGVVKGA